jgi:tetratricopeptide (TPR) repeat protein
MPTCIGREQDLETVNGYWQAALQGRGTGDLEKAETSLNEAIALFQQMHSFRLGEADLTLAALRLAQGNPSAALTAAQEAARIFTEIEYYRRGEARLWEAKCQLALRNAQAARAGLADANATFARQQQPHHAAEAKLVEGQLLLAESGDNAQALTLFTEAKATFVELGLKRLEKEVETLINTSNERM